MTTTTTPQEAQAPTVARLASNTIVQAIGIPLQSLISLGTYAVITRYLVSYDIADPDRLRKVHAVVKATAQRVQDSVYEALLTEKELVLLEDDAHLQLADNIAPVIRTTLLSKAPPDLQTSLNSVSAKLTTAELTRPGQPEQQVPGRQHQAAEQRPPQRRQVVPGQRRDGQQPDQDRVGGQGEPVGQPLDADVDRGEGHAEGAEEAERERERLAAEPAGQQRQHRRGGQFEHRGGAQGAPALRAAQQRPAAQPGVTAGAGHPVRGTGRYREPEDLATEQGAGHQARGPAGGRPRQVHATPSMTHCSFIFTLSGEPVSSSGCAGDLDTRLCAASG